MLFGININDNRIILFKVPNRAKLQLFNVKRYSLLAKMVKKLQYSILLLALAATVAAFKLLPKLSVGSVKTIVIDPGHGGKDPGCLGAIHKEKDISLGVALKLGKFLEDNYKDVKVIFTRTTDVFVDLEERAQIANKAKADLFISIHCNAAGKAVMVKDPKTGKKRPKMRKNQKGRWVPVETTNPIPFGTETYVMGLKNEAGKMKVAARENSAIFYEDDYEKKYGGFDPESEESYIIMSNYTSAYVIQSAGLALKIQNEYAKKAGRIDKGVHRQSIWVLWRTSMPSVLTEIGYLTNPLEETFLGSEQGQDYLAKALFRGLRKYKDEVEGTKKTYNDEFENQIPLENENIKAGNIPGQKKAEDEDEEDVMEEKTVTEIKKEKLNDSKYAEIDLNKDSAKASEKNDTVLSAKLIVEKYKKEKQEETATLEKKKNLILINDIVFKVQIASSDVPINLKQEKFASLVDCDFYTMNNNLKYTSGYFNNYKSAVAHQSSLREKGFKDCFVIALKKGERIDLNEAKKLTGQR